MKSRILILGLALLAMPTFGAYAQSAYKMAPEQMLYTTGENGSHLSVGYNFTNLSDFPIWLWPTYSDSPEVIAFIGDLSDQALYLGGYPHLFPTPSVKVDPGQTHLSYARYLFLIPNEAAGTDWGLTFYKGPTNTWATITDDVSGPRAPAGTVDGFAIKIIDSYVPEPATWAMMLGGFGLVGAALRARRKLSANFA